MWKEEGDEAVNDANDQKEDAGDIQARIQAALERLERASPEEVAETQLGALERIIRHAFETSPFYAERLAPLLRNGEFTPQNWHEVPLLAREEAEANAPALRSIRPPEGTEVQEGVTSGSTGTPLRFAWSTLATVSTRALVERMAVWHRLDPTAPLAEIRSFSNDQALLPGRRVRRSWNFRAPDAPFYQLAVTTPIPQQLDWLRLLSPRYLLTYPTLARELALETLATNMPLRLDAILTVGEVLTPEIRAVCRHAFGAKVIDSYGCREMGKIALECDVSGSYHVCTSNVLLEVLDENGRQVRAGEAGRIVLTSLYNYAMPFIRYDIGDIGRLGGRCECGRSMPLLTEILGRRRNMIALPDGSRLWLPGSTLAAMAEHVPLKRMRLVQRAPDRFDLLYVPKDGAASVDHAGLDALTARLLHPAVKVTPIAVDQLVRSEGGKYEDVVGLH